MFLMSKLLWLVFFILKDKFEKCRKIFLWLNRNTRKWSFISMVIQGNLMILTFDCFLQLIIAVSLNFLDKFNLIICFMFLFFTFSYATYF